MPEGFFANTHEIYAEIASYPVVPPEKIKQYWNGIWSLPPRDLLIRAFRLTQACQFILLHSEGCSTLAHTAWRTFGGMYGEAINAI